MGQKSGPVKQPAEQVVKEIRRATRRQFTAEEKIRIVRFGLRGEDSIAELSRHEGILHPLTGSEALIIWPHIDAGVDFIARSNRLCFGTGFLAGPNCLGASPSRRF